MKPYILFPLIGEVHTNSLLILLSFVGALIIFGPFLKKELKEHQISLKVLSGLIFGTSLFAFIGARLFHVVVERPEYFFKNPSLILTQFDGMTFYGALGLGCLFAYVYLNKSGLGPKIKDKIWDAGTLSTCLTIALMRLGCFANGCCWGKISSKPWAVQYYDPRSVMPYKGIPVHPVQVYDAALGLSIGVILWVLWKEKIARGHLFLVFAILYPLSRFVTEFFRADTFRGENVLFGLSTSQVISVAIFGVALAVVLQIHLRKNKN